MGTYRRSKLGNPDGPVRGEKLGYFCTELMLVTTRIMGRIATAAYCCGQ
jgi:hypothetical protein